VLLLGEAEGNAPFSRRPPLDETRPGGESAWPPGRALLRPGVRKRGSPGWKRLHPGAGAGDAGKRRAGRSGLTGRFQAAAVEVNDPPGPASFSRPGLGVGPQHAAGRASTASWVLAKDRGAVITPGAQAPPRQPGRRGQPAPIRESMLGEFIVFVQVDRRPSRPWYRHAKRAGSAGGGGRRAPEVCPSPRWCCADPRTTGRL